ncbi:hypothetical protein HYFRA_00001939 [Hymenoscyphus fraxineus]|uniref:Uncharacterized protein n=1 Tax=Hymenoscyphus fraxineus TaxID=746836 RepID=A0A9N9PJN0_9HELO|nr:hypothetical protein HYFRA_00001939 [Hymenoscyphus fraxineus]
MDSLARTLPASWFCSEPLYQLERRGVFQKSWHFLGPITRFQNRSEKVIYEIAQTTLVVENRSPPSDGITFEGVVVYAQDEVEISQLTFATFDCYNR